jgi:lambda family phage tail tape measure protein
VADSILDLLFSADTKDLDKAKEKLSDLGSSMPTVGEGIEKLAKSFANIPGPVGVAVAAFVGFAIGLKSMIEGTIESETRLLELSESMGMTVDKAQPFIEAMALAGIEGTKLQASMTKLAQAIGQAVADPAGKAADAFKKLGVSQDELKNGDTEQIMKDAAKGLDQYADSATKTAVIRELFGRQGPTIIAAMRDEVAMEKMAADAQEQYGTKVSETDAKSAKYFGETLKLGMTMFEGVSMSITKSLLPGLQVLVDQFAESGKEGGVMRNILDALSASIAFVAKAIISTLVEPVRFLAEVFKETGTAIGASFAAIAAAAHGNLGEAKKIITDMNADLIKMHNDYTASATKFENALWGIKDPLEEIEVTAKKIKPALDGFDAGAHKVTDTLEKLRAELTAQELIQREAAKGLNQYKAAQDEVALSTLRLQLAKEGASKADIETAVSLKQQADASKRVTADEVTGWNLINRLKTENLGLTTHQTELEKNLGEIAKASNMTAAEKSEAEALARTNAGLKQKQQLEKELAGMSALVTADAQKEIAAATLSTNQMKLFNEQLKLRKQYESDLQKDPANAEKLTAAFEKNKQAITENNSAINTFNQSMDGMAAGAHKALTNMQEDAQNLNKTGFNAMTTLTNQLTTAFMNMGGGAKQAFEALAKGILSYIEQQVIHFAIVEAELAVLAAFNITGPAAAVLVGGTPSVTKSANGNAFGGGSVIPFANGGVLGGPTMAPMALMGEAGPEAVMPLQRNSQGQLGVHVVGGGGGNSGGDTHNHNTFVINSNQPAVEVAKQAKKATNTASKFTKQMMTQQKRPGGILASQPHAFAR